MFTHTRDLLPTFTPPSVLYPDQSGDWLMDMLDIPHGITVYSTDGGATFKSSETPYLGDLASIDPTTSAKTGPSANAAEGVTYFLGGHNYTITSAQATALTASGFGAGVH